MRTVAVDGERASSTAVRAALAAGDLARRGGAARSPVRDRRPRRARRRSWAAISASRPRTCRCSARRRSPGIFAVRVHGLGAHAARGVASVGVRPTVNARRDSRCSKCSCSTSTRPIYGRRIAVEFLHKLRDEERYADLDALSRDRPRRRRRTRSSRATLNCRRPTDVVSKITNAPCPTTQAPTTSPR